MPEASYSAPRSREPVYYRGERVRGLVLRHRSDGTTVFEAAVKIDGRVIRRTFEDARTVSDAVTALRRLQAEGVPSTTTAPTHTVDELADRYLAAMRARIGSPDPRRRRAPRTVSLAESRLRHVRDAIGTVTLERLDVRDVRRLLGTLERSGLAPTTVHGITDVLSSALSWAVREGLADRNPVADLAPDERPQAVALRQRRFLDETQGRTIIAGAGDVFGPIAAVCLYSGLRISEALGLVWADVDFETKQIHVHRQLESEGDALVRLKTGTSRATLPLLPALARTLRDHRRRQADAIGVHAIADDALVFTTATGAPQSRRNVLRAVQRAASRAGLGKVTVHDLRRSFVSIALANGLTLPEATVLARHGDSRTTAVAYADVLENDRHRIGTKLATTGFGR